MIKNDWSDESHVDRINTRTDVLTDFAQLVDNFITDEKTDKLQVAQLMVLVGIMGVLQDIDLSLAEVSAKLA